MIFTESPLCTSAVTPGMDSSISTIFLPCSSSTFLPLMMLMLLGSPRFESKRSSIVVDVTLTSGNMPTSAYTAWLTASVITLNANTCFPFIFHPLNNYHYQKLKRADCMDEKSTWECGILSHPSIQGDQHQCDTKRKQFLTKEALLD